MENIVNVDKFQLEYDLYDFSYNGELGNVRKEVLLTFEEIDVARSFIELDRKRNRRRRVISNALGKYASKFGYEDSSYYDFDDQMLDEHSGILDRYYWQVGYIFEEMDDKNYPELCKLLAFTQYKNRGFCCGVKNARKDFADDAVQEGTSREVPTEESMAFNEWFVEALKKASCSERVVKNKK